MRRADRVLACALPLLLLAIAAKVMALPPTLERLLPTLPPAQREEILMRDASWRALTPAQQQALQQRMARWHALPAAVQAERREQWQAWRGLPREQRARLDSAATAFAALSESERRLLHERYAALDRSEQRGWRLGPALGADYMHLQPLLAQVPAAQREPLLALLRTMTPAERNDLAVLAQRVPPQQRDALRRGLLATNAGNRTAWLQLRLEQ
jgi:phosphoglycolate phosphatase-like HAD superfamily hydrolase